MLDVDLQLAAEARDDIPPEHAHVVGASISPDGRHALVWLLVSEGENPYFDEAVLEHDGERWCGQMSSGGVSWELWFDDVYATILGNDDEPLPADIGSVVVRDRGVEHEVAVERGFYFYAAWDAQAQPPRPELVRLLAVR
jgi:hypothetical protein